MSGLSAAGLGFSWSSKPTQQKTNDNKKPTSKSSKFSSQNLRAHCFPQVPNFLYTHHLSSSAATSPCGTLEKPAKILANPWLIERLVLADLNPATAKLAIGFLGPFLSAFGFLFILRIVMSWYPKLPVEMFPYIIAYAPTEPLLVRTRKIIPPLAGVDVTPVVWFGLLSFLNEILVGPQGLLVLLSQQV
ncbi:cofactor assembly- complex C (B6F [Striga hermonthica]|uniref:Cofactor assembly- complex C (B6F) n=1 Tax=Striga hermonthica TaxID=68872 RepID=A0A9N7NBU0_STRHE|nr:cofactor assembly- complex C (B6F [Striga hermonthica]